VSAKPPLSSEDQRKLAANLAAAKRGIERLRRGQSPSESCAFCNQPITITPFPETPPYTSFVTGCPCGKSQGQFKGL
jgi:hypothetical protein